MALYEVPNEVDHTVIINAGKGFRLESQGCDIHMLRK